jgi:hypothetical protein
MTTLRPARALLALALVAAAPSPARADDVEEARTHFRRGAAHFERGRYREAIAEFQAAYRLKPHGAIHFNVAQCRERLEQWPDALRSYEDYLREVPGATDRAAVRAAVGRIEARLAAAGVQALLVWTDPPGAAVAIDGKALGRTPFHISLPPASYRLALAMDGYEPEEREVTVERETSRRVDLVLRPAAVRPPGARAGAAPVAAPHPSLSPPARGEGEASAAPAATPRPSLSTPARGEGDARAAPDLSARPVARPPASAPAEAPSPPAPPAGKRGRRYTWVAAGTAVAAAGAAAYYGMAARERSDTLLDGTPRADADALSRDARSRARTANVLWSVSGAAAAAGITLFFVEGRF